MIYLIEYDNGLEYDDHRHWVYAVALSEVGARLMLDKANEELARLRADPFGHWYEAARVSVREVRLGTVLQPIS